MFIEPIPQIPVRVYHQDHCNWRGQLGAKYSGELIRVYSDKTCQYLLWYMTLLKCSGLAFIWWKWFIHTVLYICIQPLWHLPPCSVGWMGKQGFLNIFIVGHQRRTGIGVWGIVKTQTNHVVGLLRSQSSLLVEFCRKGCYYGNRHTSLFSDMAGNFFLKSLNPLQAEFIWGNPNSYLHYGLCLYPEML